MSATKAGAAHPRPPLPTGARGSDASAFVHRRARCSPPERGARSARSRSRANSPGSYVQIPKLRAQCLHCAEIMCLDAALRAAHGSRRGGYVESLERPQQECLLLTPGQRRESLLERAHRLIELEPLDRLRLRAWRLGYRVRLFVVPIAAPKGQPRDHATPDRAPALHVPNAVLENAVEERLPLLLRAVGVGTRELEHRILHRIQRVVLVPERRLRDLESLELDAGQKLVQRTGACLGFVRQVHVAVCSGQHAIRRRERSKLGHGLYNARPSAWVDG